MLPIFKKLLGVDTTGKSDLPQELVHINQEMYKKSVELSEKNKTLLLLRKIDEIILSSITDKNQIAQNVTSVLVSEAGFKIATLYTLGKNDGYLKRLAISRSSKNTDYNDEDINYFYLSNIPTTDVSNMVVHSITARRETSSNTLQNSILSANGEKAYAKIQDAYGIKSVFTHPLVVREQLIGAFVVCLTEEEQDISEYTRDLLERLVQVIGIAIDNATLYNEVEEANEKLKVLDKLKDEFVSLASHELRTPMTAIKSYLWMALSQKAGTLNEIQKKYLERAYSSVDRLIKLVNDMLNISRIESGRLTVEMQKVSLVNIVREVIDEVSPRAGELKVNVSIVPSTDQIPDVIADPDKIKEVLFNLIGNSMKFTPQGGNITIAFSLNGDFVETKIKDTGAGISTENISKLFQKFSMLPESYKNNTTASGTGLGLYIARSIVELHNGKIWALSEGPGKGSEFAFTLKIYREDVYKASINNATKPGNNSIGIVHTQL